MRNGCAGYGGWGAIISSEMCPSVPVPDLPQLHILVDESVLDVPQGVTRAAQLYAATSGGIALHLRVRLPPRQLLAAARELREAAEECGGWLVVNGRLDVAMVAGAHAVQLGRGALSVADARRAVSRCGREIAIGASVHSVKGAKRAVQESASYLVLGTIYPTPSHPGAPGAGLSHIEGVARALPNERRRPILTIGGLKEENVAEVLEAGAHGIVVGRAVWGAADPPKAAARLTNQLRKNRAIANGSTEPSTI